MHRWRPVLDESAQNSLAGSTQGSNLGGTTQRGVLSGDTSRVPHINSSRALPSDSHGLTPRTSNRTSNDQHDYFRRPSMRTTMSQMSDSSSIPHSRNFTGITRTGTGRTETTEGRTEPTDTSRPYNTQTNSETHRTRTETTGLSRNQSMKTTTTETNRTRTEATVSRNTSMSTTRTVN